jgi:hypothetical protein
MVMTDVSWHLLECGSSNLVSSRVIRNVGTMFSACPLPVIFVVVADLLHSVTVVEDVRTVRNVVSSYIAATT